MRRCQCAYAPCRAAILPSEVFCRKHLVMLESDTQRALGRTFRPDARKQSATFEVIFDGALREILFYVTNGHRLPRDRQFEWDDPPEVLHGTD